MIQSVSDKLYNFIQTKLNDNDKGVHFAGNYGFKFHQDVGGHHTFSKIKFAPDKSKLDPESFEFVPFVDRSSVEIPFNERNKRSDMEVEYWFAFRIEEKKDLFNNKIYELDTKSDRYQVLMEMYQEIKETLSYTTSDMKLAFKAREPQPFDNFKSDGSFYKMVSFTLTVSKIETGMFGHESKVYFGDQFIEATEDYLLDTLEWNTIVGKEEQNKSAYNEKDNYFEIGKTTWELTATINYENKTFVNDLYYESLANVQDNNKKYKVKIVREGYYDIERTVVVTKANVAHINADPVTISFTLKLAEV